MNLESYMDLETLKSRDSALSTSVRWRPYQARAGRGMGSQVPIGTLVNLFLLSGVWLGTKLWETRAFSVLPHHQHGHDTTHATPHENPSQNEGGGARWGFWGLVMRRVGTVIGNLRRMNAQEVARVLGSPGSLNTYVCVSQHALATNAQFWRLGVAPFCHLDVRRRAVGG